MSKTRLPRWWSDPRQWLRALLVLDDTPHRIALGAAIGVFVAFTPTVGIQMLIVLLIAAVLRPVVRFNKMAALIAVYISNPLTMIPLYWFNYTVGSLYFPSSMTRTEFAALFQYHGLAEWWSAITRLFVEVGVPLLFGSVLVGGICAVVTYPLLFRMLRRVQSHPDSDHARPTAGTSRETVKQRSLGA